MSTTPNTPAAADLDPLAQDPRPGTGEGTLLGLPGGDDQLLAILAAAAPFPERVSGEYFVPVRDRGRRQISERSSRWLHSAVGDDETAIRALFLHRQRTGRDLGAGLLDVAVRDPGHLPDWAYALVEFLLAQPLTATEDPATGMVGAPFVAFRRAAERLVDWRGSQLRGVPVSSEATEDVVAQLVSRLTEASSGSFSFETRIFAPNANATAWLYSTKLDVSRSGWMGRLESLPGLAFVIGVTCLQWQRTVRELFDRLHADLPLIRRELWGWADPGPLDRFSGDSGDLHDHGRVVVVLTFTGGQRLVYKPKDLRSAAGFMDVLEYLNHHGLPLQLPTRKIIARDGYGWEEFAAAAPCADPAGATAYYTRLGMLVRLTELLECRDFWADNLLAIGDGPAFIDLENVLQARIRKPVMLGERLKALWSRVEDTAVKTACVTYPRLIGLGTTAQDIGCLAALQEQIAEVPESFPLGWEVPPYRPTCGGELADPREHAQDVIAGYRAMQQCLADNRAQLADPRGPLVLLHGATVRYIWRNTFDSMELLRASVSPLALVDGVAREVVLAQVMRSVRELLHEDSARADVLEIVEEEIDAFRRMDVPLFQSRTDSDSAFTPDGTEIAGHFDGTAWDRLQRRLGELADFPLDEHLAILESCLDIARRGAVLWRTDPADPDGAVIPRPQRGTYVYHPASLSPELAAESLIQHAREVADAILDAAHPVDDRRLGWLGLVDYPAHGIAQLEPMHGDLLSGTAGLAIFMAELYQSTAKPTYWNALHEALDGVVEFAVLAQQSGIYRRMSGQLSPVGAFVGVGAAIYALSRCGQLIGEPQLVRKAAEFLPLASEIIENRKTSADVVLGRAGLLLAVHRLREASATAIPAADALAERLHASLLADLAEPAAPLIVSPYPPRADMVQGLPAGADGIVHALARSARALGTTERDGPLLAAHSFGLDGAGSVAAALATAHHLGQPIPEAVTERVLARCASTWEHTCEHLLIDADMALWADTFTAAGDATRDDRYRLHAMRLMRSLLARRERTGKWFPDRMAADQHNLSALHGLAAVGLLCLRLTDDDATSPRLVL
jgi:class II lanthipeptide synthase